MTEKPNFFKLGIFILIAMALIVGGIILFGSGAFAEKKIFYETYFEDSVHGLDPGSPVQIGGVVIGAVEEITFVRRSYDLPLDEAGVSKFDQYIRVVCSALEEKLPSPETEKREQRFLVYVKRGFRLRLASNIITGQAYLEGTFLDSERFPVIEIPWEPQYAYIPSAPSTFRAMQDSVDRILEKLEQIEIGAITDNLNAFIEELRQSNQDLQKLIKKPDPEKELANIPILVDKFNHTLSQLDQLVTSETPEVQEIIENIRQLSENLNYLTEHLKDNPSALLFSAPPPKKEK